MLGGDDLLDLEVAGVGGGEGGAGDDASGQSLGRGDGPVGGILGALGEGHGVERPGNADAGDSEVGKTCDVFNFSHHPCVAVPAVLIDGGEGGGIVFVIGVR